MSWAAYGENPEEVIDVKRIGSWRLRMPKTRAAEVIRKLGTLPPATVVSEDGMASIMGKRCRESIKRSVDRGELPQPVKR